MGEPQNKTTVGRDATDDRFDRILDAELAKYATAEPRAGLEERVLANLRSDGSRALNRAWWRWASAAAVAVVLVALGLAWRSGKPSQPGIANRPSISTSVPSKPGIQLANRDAVVMRPHRPVHKLHTSAQLRTLVTAEPKLDQFPSPRRLSDQEKMALEYVQRFPEQAALIAEAQSALARQEQLERNAMEPGSAEPSDINKVE
ncbi:MAG TPA: hypothetical protein VGS05_16565 [Candidatus Sulfotelmatobacter sp.]|nr:hypothetical protein [Candidatus Sulfotelmatobacter sp.]